MKVYISVDIEGVAGIVDWQQTMPSGGGDYELGRRLMTEETNAAIAGALEAGATEIIVNDAHDHMRMIHPEHLHQAARLIQGTGKPLWMVEGLDASCDAVFMVGYHGPALVADGTLSHTYHARAVRYNGRSFSETAINAAVAGYYGVPTVLVAGDDAAVRDARAVLPPHIGVSVKRGITRYAADSLHPVTARERIRDGARRALEDVAAARPLVVATPLAVELEVDDSRQADRIAMMPTIERVDATTLRYVAPDALSAFRTFLATGLIQGE